MDTNETTQIGSSDTATGHQPIGDILKQICSVPDEVLHECLSQQSQQEPRQKIGGLLIDRGVVRDSDLAKGLALQWGHTFLEKIPIEGVQQGTYEKLPVGFLKKHGILPFEGEAGVLCLAVVDPLDWAAIDSVVNRLGEPHHMYVCVPSVLEQALSHYHFQESDSQSEAFDAIGEGIDVSGRETEDLLAGDGEVPVIRLVNKYLFMASQMRASDIHIEPYDQEVRIRFRIDGVLHTQASFPKRYYPSLISRLKIMAKLNIAERRLPQDGRSRIKIGDHEIDIRVSTVPTSGGERMVLRLLDESGSTFNLDQIGFEPSIEASFRSLIHRPHGIVLITGPTGSGKTTTLYGALTELNSDQCNIMTVEDPIEYRLEGIGQMQMKPKIGLTFANCLRHILRQDPDVIMVGEIRDQETARIAIQSALTGHLVLSTLHTNDSASAVTRLVDMGIEPYLVCSSVLAVMAQRLVRCVCTECHTKGEKEDGSSCTHCGGTGYHGRCGIFELLCLDDDLRELILTDCRTHTLNQAAIKKGMQTLRLDGKAKVSAGKTSWEEVLRVTQNDDEAGQSDVVESMEE